MHSIPPPLTNALQSPADLCRLTLSMLWLQGVGILWSNNSSYFPGSPFHPCHPCLLLHREKKSCSLFCISPTLATLCHSLSLSVLFFLNLSLFLSVYLSLSLSLSFSLCLTVAELSVALFSRPLLFLFPWLCIGFAGALPEVFVLIWKANTQCVLGLQAWATQHLSAACERLSLIGMGLTHLSRVSGHVADIVKLHPMVIPIEFAFRGIWMSMRQLNLSPFMFPLNVSPFKMRCG